MEISESQINKMKHTLSKGRFITMNKNKELDELVGFDFMKRVDGPFDDFVYFITEKGAKFLETRLGGEQ